LASKCYSDPATHDHKHYPDSAIRDLSDAIRLNPNLTFAYTLRGSAYAEKGNFDQAISDYDEAIRLDPNFALAYENRGRAYLQTGNSAKANADFATARRLKAGLQFELNLITFRFSKSLQFRVYLPHGSQKGLGQSVAFDA
jgi:tetratricopeptide (TPR) repeat protein